MGSGRFLQRERALPLPAEGVRDPRCSAARTSRVSHGGRVAGAGVPHAATGGGGSVPVDGRAEEGAGGGGTGSAALR